MKKLIFLCLVLAIPFAGFGQFEQKLSFSISSGVFKTFGKKLGQYDPFQMPNYQMGLAENLGLQININRRLSLVAEAGFMFTSKWKNKDYLHYTIAAPAEPDIVLAEGYNKLNFSNVSVGVKPKFFLKPGEKWNPFLFTGIYLNFTSAKFEDNWWYDAKKTGQLSPEDLAAGPYDPFLKNSTGVGINPGLGLEYNPSDKIGLSLSMGYYFMFLNKDNFKNELLIENFNALVIQAGVRFNFLKSKKL